MQVNWSDNFERLYKQRGQHKHGIRLLALWKLQSGMSETQLCTLIGKTHKTIRLWRRLYEAGGIDALLSIKIGRGRKAHIDHKSIIEDAIEHLSRQQKGGRLRAQDLVDYFAQEKQITYSLSGMYHVLHRLGFSWITSRSKHPKQDLDAIEDFKKTLNP